VDLTETELTLATANGILRVPLRDVHRAKRVPPARRARAADVAALELAANDAWPAPVQDRLGAWVLRAADNWTGRGNSALAVGDPDRPIEAAIDAVEQWYADRGQRALINAPMPLAAPVNAALDARGWTTWPLTLVQTAPLTALLAPPEQPEGEQPEDEQTEDEQPEGELPDVELHSAPTDAWLAMVAQHKGELPGSALQVLTGVPLVRFAHVYDEAGGLLAVARGTVTGPDRWHGVTLVQVAPGARRRGLARHVMRGLSTWAAREGATRAFLQVEQRNTAAVALYGRIGFHTHHTYFTRQAPPD
jgi:ribosomal protein S18 acetylase RimI-like enzyme